MYVDGGDGPVWVPDDVAVAGRDPAIPPDLYGRRAEDGMLALRREYDQLLDELGVKEELIRTLRRREAQHLEAIERQALVLAKLDELVGDRDIIRGSELRTLLGQIR